MKRIFTTFIAIIKEHRIKLLDFYCHKMLLQLDRITTVNRLNGVIKFDPLINIHFRANTASTFTLRQRNKNKKKQQVKKS